MQKGIVTKSTGSWYEVLIDNKEKVSARLKGLMRLDESIDTNPIAVGDEVIIENEGNDWMIKNSSPRKNFIVRASPKHKGARQIIAANLDQCFLVVTMSNPRTSTGFIDRFLIIAEAYHIPTHLVFNKQDALDEKGRNKQKMITNIYQKIGYPIHLVAAEKNENIEEIKSLMKGKTTLVAGHSGVGKSTLLNALEPTLQVRTNNISKITGKGMHTTTNAEMHTTSFDAKIIDTPGIKEFGIMHLEPETISHYFVEFRQYLNACKFNNCMHENEPNCAVKAAYQQGEIAEMRYLSYLNIMQDYRAAFKHWE